MKTIILCGDGKWANAISQEVSSTMNVNIKFCDSTKLMDFAIWKTAVINAHVILADIPNGTDTMLELLTMAQCFNKATVGLFSSTEGIPTRLNALCDDLCNTDEDATVSLHEVIEQFI